MKKVKRFFVWLLDWTVFIFTGGGEIARRAEADGILRGKREG